MEDDLKTRIFVYIYMEDDLKTISAVFFHLIMVLCDGLSANHAKFASYIASLNFDIWSQI